MSKEILSQLRGFVFSFAPLVILLSISGCITMGSGKLMLRQDLLPNQYDTIRKIVIEEAANNGFSQLTSEIKPSKTNNWKGKMYFSLMTPNGTDELFVEFEKQGESISVNMYGAGTRTNPDSAIKAITARLGQL